MATVESNDQSHIDPRGADAGRSPAGQHASGEVQDLEVRRGKKHSDSGLTSLSGISPTRSSLY